MEIKKFNGVKFRVISVIIFSISVLSCSITKYVPDNSSLLKSVKFKDNNTKLTNSELHAYLLQKPNSYIVGLVPFSLGMYSMSGRDTTKLINRILRKVGEPPVILDTNLIYDSRLSLQQALENKGYLDATTSASYTTDKKRTKLVYTINSGSLYKIRYFSFDIPSDSAREVLNRNYTINSLEGRDFDVDKLNALRDDITRIFRNIGYYKVQKEIFSFVVDTTELNKRVDIKLVMNEQYKDTALIQQIFTPKYIDRITIHCYEELDQSELSDDTIHFGNYTIVYNSKRHIFRPQFLMNKVFISRNQIYNERIANRTVANFTSIASVKYANIAFVEKEEDMLDCNIYVFPSEKYSYSIGVESNTNSGATVGAATSLGFADKNLFHNAEMLKVDTRVAYDLFRRNYSRYQHAVTFGGDISLVVPKLLVPYFKEDFKLKHGASTKFSVNYTYQTHPDFRRSIANTTVGYQWQVGRSQYGLDIVDLSYIKVDSVSQEFLKSNPNLRPTFEDHLVLKLVFNCATTNRFTSNNTVRRNYFSFRGRLSTGGNAMYLISKAINQQQTDGKYRIFNTPYSQFLKGDMDYSFNMYLSDKLRIVYHAMLGIGVPYGNANILPFEERFFAGGSNSMRGWNARMLGPGNFYSRSNSYLSQNGDIKLELNAEARFKLFWVLEGAFFVDAGNIWTIREYDDQKGGHFSLNNGKIFKEVALNYGLGFRFDFDYFLIRLDLGLKLYDPRYPNIEERWALTPKYGGGEGNRIDNIVALQFAIGYPF